ncbi:MAG: hypothetical protein A2600_01540 [Candidatus Lambdaproteobacteria bacterium RIFOXYD1_FULL_56_27]|uniref:ABC transporter domain-containing protein n=1 Tax=Candidatus Lambdaproteobacteria bacterium RIFOXYD2_FULL_56_26 TaxID=1817773 RepID=A0A1F6GQY5_9PROT|nr:MAG: hypothetical protein A2557_10325 [Candidatus Lambdaproteobacteria bacterium RIFOXYD2_FULL_56_26]OGH06957.1 MAG: hypothetical protein A2600_01540 [Candidatus Lambdaproteobacteria bacterium RIFOXYD1_FULL_56_27]
MLRLKNLNKRFGSHEVLSSLDLEIQPGSVFGLLGPNGAGKTTLIRMIVGLLEPDGGTLEVLGGSPHDLGVRQKIGYMPQEPALYPGLTVAENLTFFGRCFGLGRVELKSRLEEMLELTELTDQRDQLVEQLSGGTARRVLLATTLIHHPRFLVLDEPTSGVDPLLRRKFWLWLQDLARKGATVLVTTHHISEAEVCAQVLFLRHGKALATGEPQALMARFGTNNLEAAFLAATLGEEGP